MKLKSKKQKMKSVEITGKIIDAANALRKEVMEDEEITATTRMMVCGGVYALEERLLKVFTEPFHCAKRSAGLLAYVPCREQCEDCKR